MRLRQASGSRPDATVAARCSPLPVRRRRANLVSHLPWQTGASGARGCLLFKAAGNPPAARGLPNGDLAARMQPRAGAPVRSRERRPSFGRTTDGVSGPGRCNLRRGRSRRIPAATARSRSACALPELAAPNPQELSAQRSAFRPARSSTWQANRNPEEMRAHRFPSREWGAGIRQNSGQNERSRAVQPSPRPW